MRPSALLILMVLSLGSIAAEPAVAPAPQLLRLESVLSKKLEERKSGDLPLAQYRVFAAKFHADLDAVLAQIPGTSVNRGRHAMILARLDESGAEQAMVGLNQALEASPGEAALLNARGTIQLEQGDYAGALESAEAVLKRNEELGEAPDPEAVAIRHFSKGRGAAIVGKGIPAAAPPNPAEAAAGENGGRPAIQFAQRQTRKQVEVPSIATGEGTGESENEASGPAYFHQSLAWTQGKIEGAQQGFVRWLGRKVGFRPGEEEAALKGSLDGAILGTAIVGVGGAVGGGIYCSPGAVTGGPYVKCILAGGAGGIVVGSLSGAVIGGTLGVIKKRSSAQYDKFQGKEPDSE